MRIGQKSFIVFVSKAVGSALGLIATIYFARILGAEILGYYALIISIAAWIKLFARAGFMKAINKRVSEGEERSEYFTAGAAIVGMVGLIGSIFIVIFYRHINSYIGINAAHFVLILFLVELCYNLVTVTLKGERLVHVAGILQAGNIVLGKSMMVIFVFFGWKIAGMVFGNAIGSLAAGVLGLLFLSVGISKPQRRHFRSLFDYAKFSWIGNLKYRAFKDVDIVVLGAFVSANFVGIYSVAWSIANFFTIFGNAINSTLFPEISHADSTKDDKKVANLISDSLTYGGLLTIPGFFGALLLSKRILRIYGNEFTQGSLVFSLFMLSILIYGYQKQLMNGLNAVNRPDIAFKVNVVFIFSNLILNIILISWIGWTGAAVATVISPSIGLLLSYWLLTSVVDFDLPTKEISKQVFSAILMSVAVLGTRRIIENTVIQHNILIVVSLSMIGAIIYFLVLILISSQFRTTVLANSPDPPSILGEK